jgi:hypothetical protein
VPGQMSALYQHLQPAVVQSGGHPRSSHRSPCARAGGPPADVLSGHPGGD